MQRFHLFGSFILALGGGGKSRRDYHAVVSLVGLVYFGFGAQIVRWYR